MRKSIIPTLLGAAVLSAGVVGGAASSHASEQQALQELQTLILQQQQMMERQSQALKALQGQVDVLRAKTEQNSRSMIAAQERAASAEKKADTAVRTVESAAAADKTVMSGNDKVKLSISGQVNRALMLTDDSDQTDLHHVDNDASSTRFRMIGNVRASEDVTVGAAIELQIESNSSSVVSQSTRGSGVDQNISNRRLEFTIASKRMGKLWVGQGWTATEGTSEVDLSGTALAGYSDVEIVGGGLFFRNSDGTLSSTSVGSVFNNVDGLGRSDRLRYDTPDLSGFKASIGATQGSAVDLALRYSRSYGDTKVAAALAYADRGSDSPSVEKQYNGSASILFGNGFNVTFAGGAQDFTATGRDNLTFFYGKLGYRTNAFDAGMTSFAIDGGIYDDVAMNGDEAASFGLQITKNIDAWGMETYLGLRHFTLDRSGSSFDDVNTGILGARVKF